MHPPLTSPLSLRLYPWELAVCKLPTAGVPAWAEGSAFVTYSRTDSEYSLVYEARLVPADIQAEHGWTCMGIEGTLDFGMVGVIAALTAILAAEQISVFVLSTFDTDYLLVRQAKLASARAALVAGGYRFRE